MEVNLKVFCKYCKHFPRLGPLKAVARCKKEDIKWNWDSLRWVRKYCSVKNMGNDCENYERRKTRNANKEE